jgi:hypothetical protein
MRVGKALAALQGGTATAAKAGKLRILYHRLEPKRLTIETAGYVHGRDREQPNGEPKGPSDTRKR